MAYVSGGLVVWFGFVVLVAVGGICFFAFSFIAFVLVVGCGLVTLVFAI